MDECLCRTVGRLVANFDESRIEELVLTLNSHLGQLRALLSRSRSLARDVQYQIIPNNQRTAKVMSIHAVNLSPVNRVFERFGSDPDAFWELSEDPAHVELRRRLICVILFLRSKLDAEAVVPPRIAKLLQGQNPYIELKNAGRKYIKIGRRLGNVGCLFWLPLEIPPSTYERYINLDDEQSFSHLMSLAPEANQYTGFVRHLIMTQLTDPPTICAYENLSTSYSDIISGENQLLLLLYALGGTGIPEVLLRSIYSPQRRWSAEGEIEQITAVGLNLPFELADMISDNARFHNLTASPDVTRQTLDDGTVAWSLCTELQSHFSRVLLPQTLNDLSDMALKLICLACPPCYEGNTSWSPSLKKAMWELLENILKRHTVSPLLRSPVLEAILYFGERDSVMIRRVAVEQARSLLRKPMPYYLHASVVLFQSILYRIDGDLAKAEAQIRDFLWRGPSVANRRDHALLGRLHISLIENKIKCYDSDVPSFIYKWQAEQPLSTLEIEVTSRLQTAAARFFQSIGDFGTARVSLEQFLSLNTTKPIRSGTRHIIVGRLADMHCEMKEYSKAIDLLQTELDSVSSSERQRRSFRRLLLASAEANIGLNRLDVAEALLQELHTVVPLKLDDLHDQQLHMRHLLAAARAAHMRPDPDEAILRWRFALQEVERMHTLNSKRGFTAAMIYMSMAHAQLSIGDRDGGRHSWATGAEILRSEICEFWIPVVPTIWLPWVAMEIHALQGWSFRMALPGGKPDVTCP